MASFVTVDSYFSGKFWVSSRRTPRKIRIYSHKTSLSRCVIMCPKCSKTHQRASATQKNFSRGLPPPAPPSGRGKVVPPTFHTMDRPLKTTLFTACCDMDLQTFALEYGDVLDLANIENLRKMQLKDLIATLVQSNTGNFSTVNNVPARLLAAKPHGADVERLISASNNLKSSGRSSMSIETSNLYLYIKYNMPVVTEWDPRAAVMHWLNDKKGGIETERKKNSNLTLTAFSAKRRPQRYRLPTRTRIPSRKSISLWSLGALRCQRIDWTLNND